MKKILVLIFVIMPFSLSFSVDFGCSRDEGKKNKIYLGSSVVDLTSGSDKLKCKQWLAKMQINTLDGNDKVYTLKSDNTGTVINLWNGDDYFSQKFYDGVLANIVIDGGSGYDIFEINRSNESLVISGNCAESCKIYVKDKRGNPDRRFKNVTLKNFEEIKTTDKVLKFNFTSNNNLQNSDLHSDTETKYEIYNLNFYWNTKLDLTLPFTNKAKLSWNIDANIKFSLTDSNACYIPLFWFTWGFYSSGYGNTVMLSGNFNWGIYYDCKYSRNEIIKNYCSIIKSIVIEKWIQNACDIFHIPASICNLYTLIQKYFLSSLQFYANIDSSFWSALVKANFNINYISIFQNPEDNLVFYEYYCDKDNWIQFPIPDTKTKEEDNNDNSEDDWDTNSTGFVLPPWVKIDPDSSSIIFYFWKSYLLPR